MILPFIGGPLDKKMIAVEPDRDIYDVARYNPDTNLNIFKAAVRAESPAIYRYTRMVWYDYEVPVYVMIGEDVKPGTVLGRLLLHYTGENK